MGPAHCFLWVFDRKFSRRVSLLLCGFPHPISSVLEFILNWGKKEVIVGISYLGCLILASLMILWSLQLISDFEGIVQRCWRVTGEALTSLRGSASGCSLFRTISNAAKPIHHHGLSISYPRSSSPSFPSPPLVTSSPGSMVIASRALGNRKPIYLLPEPPVR